MLWYSLVGCAYVHDGGWPPSLLACRSFKVKYCRMRLRDVSVSASPTNVIRDLALSSWVSQRHLYHFNADLFLIGSTKIV